MKIRACAALIKSGRYSGSGLAAVYGSRAAAYRRNKEYDRAIADFNEMIRIDPKDSDGFIGRCMVYDDKGDYDRALADCTQAIELDPENVLAIEMRANTYEAKKDYENADADYTAALRLDPKLSEAYLNRCWVRGSTGRDLPGALEDCNEALRLQPDAANAFGNRALVQLKLGAFDRAIADYSAALANNANDAYSLYGRGVAKLKSGDAAGGAADIAAAKAIQGDIADVYARYGITVEVPTTQTNVPPPPEPSEHGKSGQRVRNDTNARRSLCGRLAGTWEWFANGDVTILPNGTASQSPSGFTANWSCSNRTVVFHWSHGFIDHLTLSKDGDHLTGSNGIMAVWGNRR